MARPPQAPASTFVALEKIRETTLVRFTSLFTPERRLWVPELHEQFERAFSQRLDAGTDDFLTKFKGQVGDQSDDLIQLGAEIFYVQQFFTSLTSGAKKIQNVAAVLEWSQRSVEIPDWAKEGVSYGLAGDQSFNRHRPFHVEWINDFMLAWHKLSQAQRDARLHDPWQFQEFTLAVGRSNLSAPMRQAWLYMIFPDVFESISSRNHKALIREAFKDRISSASKGNIDRELLDIRTALERERGQHASYYSADLEPLWNPRHGHSRDVSVEDDDDGPTTATSAHLSDNGATDLRSLARELLLEPEDVLTEWADMLLTDRQVIFQGPPGTGKTFIARKLAAAVARDPSRVDLVQFHPSYAYEDFVEGYRPDGPGGFVLRDGPLKRIAKRAASDPGNTYVLVIDEINRGNLAKILGELYFLLEYRNEPMTLQYSQTTFSLPPNLLLLATMNTADRSIALLDMALRRRFRFVDLTPDAPPLKGLLGRYLRVQAPHVTHLAEMLDDVNRRLDDPHASIGPSHFLVKDPTSLSHERAERIWRHSIIPALADRFFDRPADLADFSYQSVLRRVNGAAPAAPTS